MLRLFVILTATKDLALAWVINVAEWFNSNVNVFIWDPSRVKQTEENLKECVLNEYCSETVWNMYWEPKFCQPKPPFKT